MLVFRGVLQIRHCFHVWSETWGQSPSVHQRLLCRHLVYVVYSMEPEIRSYGRFQNRGTPKWMVYNNEIRCFRGTSLIFLEIYMQARWILNERLLARHTPTAISPSNKTKGIEHKWSSAHWRAVRPKALGIAGEQNLGYYLSPWLWSWAAAGYEEQTNLHIRYIRIFIFKFWIQHKSRSLRLEGIEFKNPGSI